MYEIPTTLLQQDHNIMTPNTSTLGVLLVNLGSPKALSEEAIRVFLQEFLADRRVVDLPAWLWLPILNKIVLRKRPQRLVEAYGKIWMAAGSPLSVYSHSVMHRLQAWADQHNQSWYVDLGMTYGEPTMTAALERMRDKQVDKLLVLPMYPQYSTTTSAAVTDAFARICQRLDYHVPHHIVLDYHQHAAHINALADQVRTHWSSHGQGDKLLLSFHGTPQATHQKGDPYYAQCVATSQALGHALGLQDDQYVMTFQSRFGWQKWLQPYSEATIEAMGKTGVTHLQVLCPGFSMDCLETLEEVQIGLAETFIKAGGKTFEYISCLNDDDKQVKAFAALVQDYQVPIATLNN